MGMASTCVRKTHVYSRLSDFTIRLSPVRTQAKEQSRASAQSVCAEIKDALLRVRDQTAGTGVLSRAGTVSKFPSAREMLGRPFY